jgi:hypothetical protein
MVFITIRKGGYPSESPYVLLQEEIRLVYAVEYCGE